MIMKIQIKFSIDIDKICINFMSKKKYMLKSYEPLGAIH